MDIDKDGYPRIAFFGRRGTEDNPNNNWAIHLISSNTTSPTGNADWEHTLVKDFETIEIAGPGFLNIKLSKKGMISNINNILKDKDNYGSRKSKKTFNIEFVSANPTGPMHVGHCRGAILGDVLSNLLLFNKNKVKKEYYVNDFGGQITHFTKSIFYRIREILFKEKFPNSDKDLYPGEYLIDIAKSIIKNNKDLKFDYFNNISKKLTELSVNASLNLIKLNLKNLGIQHDNFTSERQIVLNNEVDIAIEKLKKNNFVYIGKIKAPEGEDKSKWIEREQLLFRSTSFGDDKDRALKKSDNSSNNDSNTNPQFSVSFSAL